MSRRTPRQRFGGFMIESLFTSIKMPTLPKKSHVKVRDLEFTILRMTVRRRVSLSAIPRTLNIPATTLVEQRTAKEWQRGEYTLMC